MVCKFRTDVDINTSGEDVGIAMSSFSSPCSFACPWTHQFWPCIVPAASQSSTVAIQFCDTREQIVVCFVDF